MKKILVFLFILSSAKIYSQWTTLNIPTTNPGRYDDLFFINDSIGWAAGGNNLQIYITTDGGESWKLQFNSGKYLRSIFKCIAKSRKQFINHSADDSQQNKLQTACFFNGKKAYSVAL